MATSGTIAFSETARQVVTTAFEMINVIPIGGTPGAEDAAKGVEQLNLMLRTWAADPEPKLWLTTEGIVTLLAATASYALPLARKVLSVRRRVSGVDTPVTLMSRQEYTDYPTKSSVGYPFQAWFDPQRATRTLYVINVPDATIASTTTLPYTYLRVIEDVASLNDDFDVPLEWVEVLEFGLAARLSLIYRKHLSDPAGSQQITQRAGSLYAQLAAFDEDDSSVFMQPAFQ